VHFSMMLGDGRRCQAARTEFRQFLSRAPCEAAASKTHTNLL